MDPSQNPNDNMQTTLEFSKYNEQIIADLANLEMEQEKQIYRIIFATFMNNSGLIEHEDMCILGQALDNNKDLIEDI